MKNTRQLVVEALLKVENQGAWSNLVLDHQFQKYSLNSRDSAFFSALFYGVLERAVTLDACIAAHSNISVQKLSPAVLTTLRTGVYQLLYMDSVPDHAAVAESVEVVRRLRKAQAAGFVNGVLRSFLRAKKQIPVPKEPLCQRLAVEYACPATLVEFWLAAYGEAFTTRFLQTSLGRPPLYIRVNTLRISADELISRLGAHDVLAAKTDLENCLLLENAGTIYELPEYKRGFFHVQDKASQYAALALEAAGGDRILDACAAPGGKAFTLAGLQNDGGEIIAADLHEHRVALIRTCAKKMGFKSIIAKTADATVFDPELGLFDRVLCDVPCSGLGVIRRKPEIKHKNPQDFADLPNLQYKILETTAQYCKSGARLIYSTCTLNPAENEDVVKRFLAEHTEFAPAALPAVLGGDAMRTLVDDLGADGFFIAAILRR